MSKLIWDIVYSKSVNAVLLDANGVQLLVLNVYLPWLDSSSEYDVEVEMYC